MTRVDRLDTPRSNPTADMAIGRADKERSRQKLLDEIRSTPPPPKPPIKLNGSTLHAGDKQIPCPRYGEVILTFHEGQLRYVETRVKEKVE